MRQQLSDFVSRVLRSQTLRAARGFIAFVVAIAMMATTCVSAYAEEPGNESDSAQLQTLTMDPQTVAEDGSETVEEDSGTSATNDEEPATDNGDGSGATDEANKTTDSDSATSAPEASATPEAQADTDADEGVATAAEDTTILDDFGVRSLNKDNTFDATIAILNDAEDMAMVADQQSGGMRAVPVSELDANSKNWQWQTKRKVYDGQNYFITLQSADTGQYLGWRNSEFVFVDDENDAAVFNLGEDAGAKYRLQNRTAGWPTVYFNKGSNAFVTDVNWGNQTV